MPNDFSITFDDRELRSIVEAGPRIFEIAASRSLNRGIRKARTMALRGAAKELRIPQKAIRERTFLRKATRRKLRSEIVVYSRPINPAKFSQTRQTKTGVSTVGGRSWPGAFLPGANSAVRKRFATLGAVGAARSVVFERRGRRRLPLDTHKIAIVEEVRAAVRRETSSAGREEFLRRLPLEVDFALSRAAKGGASAIPIGGG